MDLNDPRRKTLRYWLVVYAYEFGRAAQRKQYFIPEVLGVVIAVAVIKYGGC